jgi:hypothetical protein
VTREVVDGACLNVGGLGRIPAGGGWRLHGRSEAVRGRGNSYDYVHTAIDDHTHLAYSEALPNEKDPTCAGFLHRALAWFAAHGIRVRRVLTDNAKVYRRRHRLGLGLHGRAAQTPLHQTGLPLDQRQSRTVQPHPPHRMGLRPPLDQQPNPPPRP